MSAWYVNDCRKREVWQRPRRKAWWSPFRWRMERIAVYWDVCDEWGMTWPLERDREGEPGLISFSRLVFSGWRRPGEGQ